MRIKDPRCVVHRADQQMEPGGFQPGAKSGTWLGRYYRCLGACQTALLRRGEFPGAEGEASLLFRPWDEWARLAGGRLYLLPAGRVQLHRWRNLPSGALNYVERVQRRVLFLLCRRSTRGISYGGLLQVLRLELPQERPLQLVILPQRTASPAAWGRP